MGLTYKSPLSQFRPKKITVPELYKHSTGAKDIGGGFKNDAIKALKNAGMNESEAAKIISGGRELTPEKAKIVSAHLSKNKIYGFNKDPKFLVEKYLRHEAVKRKNISRVMHERMLEENAGPLSSVPKDRTSLNKYAQGNNRSSLNKLSRGSTFSKPAGSSLSRSRIGLIR